MDMVESLRGAGEGVEAIEQGDCGEEEEREPGRIGLEGGMEDEGGAADVLGAEGVVESDVGDAD